GRRAQDPVAVHLQLAPVGPDERCEGLPIPGPRQVEQVHGHRAPLPSPKPSSSVRGCIGIDAGTDGNWAPASGPVCRTGAVCIIDPSCAPATDVPGRPWERTRGTGEGAGGRADINRTGTLATGPRRQGPSPRL